MISNFQQTVQKCCLCLKPKLFLSVCVCVSTHSTAPSSDILSTFWLHITMRMPTQLLFPGEIDSILTTPCLPLILEGSWFGRHTSFTADNAIVNAETTASSTKAPFSHLITSCGSCGRKWLLGGFYTGNGQFLLVFLYTTAAGSLWLCTYWAPADSSFLFQTKVIKMTKNSLWLNKEKMPDEVKCCQSKKNYIDAVNTTVSVSDLILPWPNDLPTA